MASWTREDVKLLAPEFGALSDVQLDRYVAWAASEINESVHGARAARAGSLLTAHLLTIFPAEGGGGSGVSGPVVRERVGEVEVQYSDPANLNRGAFTPGLSLSRYGIEYQRLVRLAASGPWVL